MTLPDFLVLGAQKAGSSWLNHKLRGHPDIFMPQPLEVKFFNKPHCTQEHMVRRYEALFAGARERQRVGEKTPGYFWTAGRGGDYQGLMPQKHNKDIPAAIRQVLGDETQLIISLRHPVSRAISAYFHHLKRKRISPSQRLRDVAYSFGILDIGFYDRHLSNYFGQFDKNNFFICTLEDDITNRPEQTLENLAYFLKVDADPFLSQDFSRVNASSDVQVTGGVPKHAVPEGIEAADVAFLLGAYEGLTKRVEELLERELREWQELDAFFFANAIRSTKLRAFDLSTVECSVELPVVEQWHSGSGPKIKFDRSFVAGCKGGATSIGVRVNPDLGASLRLECSECGAAARARCGEDRDRFLFELTCRCSVRLSVVLEGASVGHIEAANLVRGREEWLFLYKDSNRSFDQRVGDYSISAEMLERWEAQLQIIEDACGERNVPWSFVIAPSKEDVLVHMHPVPRYSPQPIDLFLKRFAGRHPIIDPRPAILANNPFLAFAKHETHWTHHGAKIAVNEVLSALSGGGPMPSCSRALRLVRQKVDGDLGAKLRPKVKKTVLVVDPGEAWARLVFDNGLRVGHGRTAYWVSDNASDDRVCAVFGGSSAFWMVPWLSSVFRHVVYVYTSGLYFPDLRDLLHLTEVAIFQTNARYLVSVQDKKGTCASIRQKFATLSSSDQAKFVAAVGAAPELPVAKALADINLRAVQDHAT